MTKPLSASRLVEILRAEGVTVHEVRNWRTHNRNAKGPWGPMNGVMIHHTVASGTDSSVVLCYDGYAPPPGPLCHGVIDKKGHVHMVGKGRASHAGLGDGDILPAAVNETKLPPGKEADTDGNRHFYASSASASATAGTPGPRRRRRPSRRSRPRSAATTTGANAPSSATRSGSRASRTRAAHDGRHALPHREPPAGQAGRRRRLCPRPQPRPEYAALPGAGSFQIGRRDAVITAMGKRLVAEGCGRYEEGPSPDRRQADRRSPGQPRSGFTP